MDVGLFQGATFPLSLAQAGERVRVISLNGGRGMDRKLTELGLPLGSEIRVVSGGRGGPMVIANNDTRIALGGGMAHRIMVARVADTSQ